MPERTGIVDLYARAAAATSVGSKSFYFATKFFPPELARAAHSVYWFCRTTDDIVDEATDANQAGIALDGWEADLRDALEGREVDDPVLRLFAETQRQYGIPAQYPLDLVAGMRMDLGMDQDGWRYQTFDQLRVFCYRVASVVGLMMMHVIGLRKGASFEEATARATDLGIAMQLTNILRDIGEDLRRARVYLPLHEIAAHGYSIDALEQGLRYSEFADLMRFQCERARGFYASGESGIELLSERGRFAVQVAARVYAGILQRIERSGYDVFDKRAVVPPVQKYWITARTLAVPAFRRVLSI
jgi:phytoene synthase